MPTVPNGATGGTLPKVSSTILKASCVTCNVIFRLPISPVESTTERTTGKLPAAAGVPFNNPAEFIERPVGSPVADQEYGAVPPDDVKL
jgi:hypothetical protein